MSAPTGTTMPATGSSAPAAKAIESTIQGVELLYQAVTGQASPPPDGPHAPIPPEADAFEHVASQFDRLLTQLAPLGAQPTWSPPVTAWEQDGALVVAVDLPGVPREAIRVTVDRDAIVVAGERVPPCGRPRPARLHAAEQVTGPFRRVVRLPPRARAADASAALRDGVLELRVPLTNGDHATPRKIPVS